MPPSRRSLLRHPGLAQAGEMGGFEQGSDFRYSPIADGLQAREARKSIVQRQPPGFGEFGGGALDFAGEAIGCSEVGMGRRMLRHSATRLLEPCDRLARALA